ncbi:MAG: glycosyltransferase family 2 protein [Elusimicrobia bacterium]|nr:glycosyltransferase family 2 protein [Elusimicrobiota bacterium]
MSSPELSVIVPVHNEERRLPRNLPRILGHLEKHHPSFELLLCEDGSTDRTVEVARTFLNSVPGAKILSFPIRRGKGYGVRRGVLASCGRHVLFLDVDLSTPLETISEALRGLAGGADMVIGSRALEASKITRPQPPHRRMAARLFNFLRNALLGPGIARFADSQCGFKALRGDAGRELFSRMAIDGFLFDVELLSLALRQGWRILEIPVTWGDDPGSQVRFFSDGWRTVRDLWRIRRALKGY